ncbi:MAG: hypothetical protein CMH56_07270 [Myxococcales bacterium]|nr:hypothetical protein [Myxococcales bacterium]
MNMMPFLSMIPAPELLPLALIPMGSIVALWILSRRQTENFLLTILLITQSTNCLFAWRALQRIFYAGGYHDLALGAPEGGILQMKPGPIWATMELTAFEALTLFAVSGSVILLTIWQKISQTQPSSSILIKQTCLWSILNLMFLTANPMQTTCLLSLGGLLATWSFKNAEPQSGLTSTWLFVQHRLGDASMFLAVLFLFFTFGNHNPQIWLTQAAQLKVIPLQMGLFQGHYLDHIFSWCSLFVLLGVLSRQGLGFGANAVKNHLQAQEPITRVFVIWVLFGGGLIVLRQTQLVHVLISWNLSWVLVAIAGSALFHAYRLFTAVTWSDADHWALMAVFSLTVLANIPYDGTAGFLQILLFFLVTPFFVITHISVREAMKGEDLLGELGGLWKSFRRQEQIRMLMTFSMCPLLGSWFFHASFMWADWAIRPYFHFIICIALVLFSFLFTAGAFKTVFQVFGGEASNELPNAPAPKSHNLFLSVVSIFVLGISIAPNILSLPVHRLTDFFDAAYAPFLSWVEPEIRTALFLLTSYQPALDVLVDAQAQWFFYGWIWGAAFGGWLFAYLVFGKTAKPTQTGGQRSLRKYFEPEQAPSPVDTHLNTSVELNVLRLTFLSRRIIQPLLAGGLMWHIWRAPSSVIRFCFWLFHNGESRRVLSVFLLFVGVSLYWWSQKL